MPKTLGPFALVFLFGLLTAQHPAVFADNLVMLEFMSKNCAACRQLEPLVRKLADKGYPIRRIDVDADRRLAEQFGIQSLPTFVVLDKEQMIDRITGVSDDFILESRLQSAFEKDRNMQGKAFGLSLEPTTSSLQPSSPPVAIRQANASSGEMQPLKLQPVMTPQVPQDVPWIRATVRIRVESPNGHDWGTGTIIDARGGDVLILTCGHIFRDSNGLGKIEVDVFLGDRTKRVPGVCLRYDADKLDLGLVKISPDFIVDVIPVAPDSVALREGMILRSTGCDNGDLPTLRQHRVRSLGVVAPWIGAPFHYIQVDNAPVQGRSGGGLFTENGYLVGVCVAGNRDDNEGLFVPASVIRQELDNVKLSCIYQSPSVTRSPASPIVLAAATVSTQNGTPLQVAKTDPMIRQPVFVTETETNQPLTLRPSGFTETRLSDREIATLEELHRRQQEGDEIIVIVRSKQKPDQPCEIIQISDVSPEFVNVLTGMSSHPLPTPLR
ncbi:MAG: trypsin-like peptidase domain-containing protein [Planctomycetaceae bacterium]|nr:trypsin-like peptidase domain-containing protein [Planctomycetaceae bacterium]